MPFKSGLTGKTHRTDPAHMGKAKEKVGTSDAMGTTGCSDTHDIRLDGATRPHKRKRNSKGDKSKDTAQPGDISKKRCWKKDLTRPDLVGGRYTLADGTVIQGSVSDYINKREWKFPEGLIKVFNTTKHTDARHCWIEIAKCLPERPVKAINAKAKQLYQTCKRGKWSPEEIEQLTSLHTQHGENWKKISSYMDRSSSQCKDKWRHQRLVPTLIKGRWKAEELDRLCKLVRRSLRMKATIPPKLVDRRQIRDDINWEWISGEMHRDSSRCAETWYRRLTSPMIPENKWSNKDDKLLLQNLLELGATSEENLNWETIFDGKEADICKKRWKEMTRLLDKPSQLSLASKLELLLKRYAPELLGIDEEF